MIEYGKKQYITDINLEIPAELITGNSEDINYDLIKGKMIIGLCGYAGSGKDEIGKPLVERLNFKRISFGEEIKKLMDNYMKHQIYEDLKKRKTGLPFEEINQLNPKNREIKEILRPYLIWFGEEMKKQNGKHHWTNVAFENIGDAKKIVITDVRRPNELTLFEQNSEYFKKRYKNRRNVNVPLSSMDDEKNDRGYESLLIHINQRDLLDKDILTQETIRIATEQWLFDEELFIDSKISDSDPLYRKNHILNHIYYLTGKYSNYFD